MKTSLRRRKARRVILTIALALLVLAALVLIAAIVFFERDSWISSRSLSDALRGARNVVLVEYSGDVEIARRIATPDEISRLRNATSVWSRPFFPETALCFVPHHRIEIVRADGSELNCAICFLCGKFAIEERSSLDPLPPYLAKPLASFFTSVGMAPKTSDEYIDLEISGRHRQTENEKREQEEPAKQ